MHNLMSRSKKRVVQCLVCLQRPLFSSSSGRCLHPSGSGLHLQHHSRQTPRAGDDHAATSSPARHDDTAALTSTAAEAHLGGANGTSKQRLSWQHVFLEAWPSLLALFLVYVVTLSLFPGVLAEDLKVGWHQPAAWAFKSNLKYPV